MRHRPRPSPPTARRWFLATLAALAAAAGCRAEEPGWIDLSNLGAWKKPTRDWYLAADAAVDPENPRRLIGKGPPGGVLINGKTGRTANLYSDREFRDLELHLEFLIPEGSNSGVKFMGLYEIQIEDTWRVKEPKGQHCGGIYPRAELLPRYRYLDEGVPPKVNAAKKPGEWQTLEAVFRAPRFDASGKKVRSARVERAVLNGKLIHEDVEVHSPTGHAHTRPEVPRGPLMLQADHGPVAFRNVRVRPLGEE
ncbi:MAG TPA: DUF1080 domain-containing protein [Gemmataceae bacterium]